MLIKNSAFVFSFRSRDVNLSIASAGLISLSARRTRQIRSYSSSSNSFSSRRVPLALISMAGQIRLSTSERSKTISRLPVPLNSSKITSSILLPVSTNAVARIVSEPPSSSLRAEPKKALGFALRWHPSLPRASCQTAGIRSSKRGLSE